jgi:hypothetical protein
MTTDPTEPLTDVADAVTETVDEAVAEPIEHAAAPVAEPAPAPYAAAATPIAPSEQRPELLIGGAFLGGMILAKLLGRRHAG